VWLDQLLAGGLLVGKVERERRECTWDLPVPVAPRITIRGSLGGGRFAMVVFVRKRRICRSIRPFEVLPWRSGEGVKKFQVDIFLMSEPKRSRT